ncbi:unnamed protein product, partial [Dibothriocephalus latus]
MKRRLLGPKRSAAGFPLSSYQSNKHSPSGLVDSVSQRRRARGRGRGRGRGKTPTNLRQRKARGNRHGGRGRSVNRELPSTRPHQVSPLFSHTRFPPESHAQPLSAASPTHAAPAISPSGPLSPPLLVRSRATGSLSENSDKLPDAVSIVQNEVKPDVK